MRVSKILLFLIISICLISIACASIPVQSSRVTSIEESSIEVPKYKTIYSYTLKGEIRPRTTDDRSEVPWPTDLRERTGMSPNYQYGIYANYFYEEIEVSDGKQTVNGFHVTLNDGNTFFISNYLQQKYKLKIGSNVEYQDQNKAVTVKKIDGKKVK